MVILRSLRNISLFHLYLFDLRPWASEPARLSKLRHIGFWSCSMRPVELSSPASTYLCVHIHVHIRYTLSIFPTLACSLASRLSSLESFRFTISDFTSRLLLILDFIWSFSARTNAILVVIRAPAFLFPSLSPMLSTSFVGLCDQCLAPVFIIIHSRCSSPISSSPTRFVRCSASLSSCFFFISFPQHRSHLHAC